MRETKWFYFSGGLIGVLIATVLCVALFSVSEATLYSTRYVYSGTVADFRFYEARTRTETSNNSTTTTTTPERYALIVDGEEGQVEVRTSPREYFGLDYGDPVQYAVVEGRASGIIYSRYTLPPQAGTQ